MKTKDPSIPKFALGGEGTKAEGASENMADTDSSTSESQPPTPKGLRTE